MCSSKVRVDEGFEYVFPRLSRQTKATPVVVGLPLVNHTVFYYFPKGKQNNLSVAKCISVLIHSQWRHTCSLISLVSLFNFSCRREELPLHLPPWCHPMPPLSPPPPCIHSIPLSIKTLHDAGENIAKVRLLATLISPWWCKGGDARARDEAFPSVCRRPLRSLVAMWKPVERWPTRGF